MAAILIVEDEGHQRLLLAEEFEGEGYTVMTAASGTEALAALECTMPDLVVLDLAMPAMDGLDLMGRLLGINNRLPIVIHTAYSSYQDNFMSWAADAYVTKRSDLGELKQAVRNILGKAPGLPKCRPGFVPPKREQGMTPGRSRPIRRTADGKLELPNPNCQIISNTQEPNDPNKTKPQLIRRTADEKSRFRCWPRRVRRERRGW